MEINPMSLTNFTAYRCGLVKDCLYKAIVNLESVSRDMAVRDGKGGMLRQLNDLFLEACKLEKEADAKVPPREVKNG